MKKKYLLYSVIVSMGLLSGSCSDYLSVEDKLENTSQNLEKIFKSEDFTEQWLAQAYSFLAKHNIDIHGRNLCMTNFADDMVYSEGATEYRKFKYAEYDESWWQNSWEEAYNGIRQASILIHNVDINEEMTPEEIADTKAQARFVRAYLYWKLLQKYGPIPLMPDEGIDYAASYGDIATPRSTYDECANFIANEMALAAKDLPLKRSNLNIARPTRGAALAARAKALLYAASPLNNPRPGDTERFTDMKDDQGRLLMGQEYNEEKWARAAAAAKDVINLPGEYDGHCYKLYTVESRSIGTAEYPATIEPPYNEKYSDKPYPQGWKGIDPLQSYQTLFNGNLYPSDNPEMIFTLGTNANLATDITQHQLPREASGWNCHSMTGKQCDAYEMNNGKPFDKDKDWTGTENYITEGEELDEYWRPLRKGVNKRYAHREPRFYASVAYNGTFWPMTSSTEAIYRNKQVFYYRGCESGGSTKENLLTTGIGIMKYVSARDNARGGGSISAKPVIGIRYADVLLWYAEALNELQPGSSYNIPSWDGSQTHPITRNTDEMSYAISRIRIRAGLPDYDEQVYKNQDEFRIKLKHERQIELFAENSRYFDLRRWRDAEVEESKQIYGHNIQMTEKEKDLFHTTVIISDVPTTFSRKMYFWPISHDELRKNNRLTQNPGWTYYD